LVCSLISVIVLVCVVIGSLIVYLSGCLEIVRCGMIVSNVFLYGGWLG